MALELASQELLPLAPVGLFPLKIQIPVPELRALWSRGEAVFQRMGILARRVVEVKTGLAGNHWRNTDTKTHPSSHMIHYDSHM